MVSYFVRYRGASQDPSGFHAYYGNQHADILRRFPAVRSLILHQPIAWTDPCPINPAGSLLLAQMTFDTPADLDAALRSPARQDARRSGGADRGPSGQPHPNDALRAGKGSSRPPACATPSPRVLTTRTSAPRSRKPEAPC